MGVGIHGVELFGYLNPFSNYVWANAAAFAAGTQPPYITASGFTMFVFLGGGGATAACLDDDPFKEKDSSTLEESVYHKYIWN